MVNSKAEEFIDEKGRLIKKSRYEEGKVKVEFKGIMFNKKTEKTDHGTRTTTMYIDENGITVHRIKHHDDWQDTSKVQIVGRTFLGNISLDEHMYKEMLISMESKGYKLSGQSEEFKRIKEEFEKRKEKRLELYNRLNEENEGKPSTE